MATLFVVILLSLLHGVIARFAPADRFPSIPSYGPLPNADYMVDNQHNYFKTAPDKGKQNGAVWAYSGSFENYMAKLRSGQITRNNGTDSNSTQGLNITLASVQMIDGHRSGTLNDTIAPAQSSAGIKKRAGSYWLPTLAPKGVQPIAGSGYKFYRNVVDYGADNSGSSDTVEAINAAIADGNRCGLECGNTFTTGALIYFPPGTYKVCTPIIQLYYTQFVGDALDPPTILGCDTFKGIALIDTDPYIPGGNGENWYINQNQFFRQIRNFKFDLRNMPSSTAENDQPLVPTGLHWQVSQACSLQNLVFDMPTATDSKNTTHVGIFMENGSGGFVSDLTFNGGNIGWRAGSQQYTAINLQFKGCLTAIQMVWAWGFNWQRINIDGSAIGFNISGRGGDTGQGIGSVSIIDSSISNTPIGVLTNSRTDTSGSPPNIVLDNVVMNNVASPVADDQNKVILGTGGTISLWATGKRYDGGKGSVQTGTVTAPKKSTRLLDSSGKLFYRARPQYENLGTSSFLVATDEGCKNDGTGDNTNAINAFLQKAQAAGQVAYFPAGIYIVGGTVVIPTGSKVQGAAWSQIQGSGFYFNDINNPHVVVQVGNKGDVGSMEIVDMMFTVRGATAGAIVLEWNVHESSQGSAGMWDTHVRVGGADGSDLDLATCPKLSGLNDRCICASLLFHVTKQASGYFENVWVWLADHDNDASLYDSPDKMSNQVSLYAARGTLIESEGPSWLYGTGSEHTVMYQYQLYGAKDVYLGHIQTETPYYQPDPVAPYPFDGQVGQNLFPGDPDFSLCAKDDVHCQEAWGLRIVNSQGITVHSAGLYSFFDEYYQDCIETESCQDRIAEVKGSTDVVIFNLFTIASEQVGSGINNEHISQNDSNQSGYTTEISVWLPSPGDDILNIVYVGTQVWATPSATCSAPCVMVFPTSQLPNPTTISPTPYTTSFEYGNGGTTVANGQTITTFFTTITTITISIPPITVGGMPYSNYNVTQGQTGTPIIVRPSVDIPPIGVPLPDGAGGTTTRTVTLPPWPDVTRGPPDGPGWGNPTGGISGSTDGVYRTPFTTTVSATKATVTTLSFPATVSPITVTCPPDTTIAFATPKTTITTQCDAATVYTLGFSCPATRVVTFLGPSAGVFTADCTLSTIFNSGVTSVPGGTGPTTTTTPTTTTPLPIWTTWPPGAIIPVTTTVDKPQPTDDGVVTPCKLWFFNICIVRDDIRILGWHWVLPPGIYPPGPPPSFIQFPPGWTTIGPLPPWPRITIGNDHQITYEQSSTECETRTASVCSTTTEFSATVTGTTTRTTATVTSSACETISGCNVKDSNTATATTTVTGCPAPSTLSRRGKDSNDDDDENSLARRQASSSDCGANAIVYPKDPSNVGEIPSLLSAYAGTYFEDKSVAGGYTSFWWVPALDRGTFGKLEASNDVSSVYYYEEYNANVGPLPDDEDPGDDGSEEIFETSEDVSGLEDTFDSAMDLVFPPRQDSDALDYDDKVPIAPEIIVPDIQNATDELRLARGEVGLLDKRAVITQSSVYWDLPMDSLPRGSIYQGTADSFVNGPNPWKYSYDDTAGSGQFVYLINEEGIWTNHDEFTQTQGTIETLGTVNFAAYPNAASPNPQHGSGCGSKILGAKLGVCKKCTMVVVPKEADMSKLPNFNVQIKERIIQQLNAVLDDIVSKNRVGKASISMSFSYTPGKKTPAFYQAMRFSLNQLVVKGKAVLVAASCNHAKAEGRAITRFPALFGSPDTSKNAYGQIDTLITVGAVDQDTYEGSFSQYADWMTTYGPGANVYVPANPSGGTNAMRKGSGTSYACPQVAALVGYLRALPSKWQTQLQEPANVKKLIRVLHRRFAVKNPINYPEDNSKRKPVIWNGQVGSKSCLIDYDTKSTWDTGGRCPTIPDDLSTLPNDPGETVATCANPVLIIPKHKRQAGAPGSCPASPSGGGGDSSGQTISITTGATANPTCASGTGCGGKLCTGYFCNPSPTGVPPGFQDPKDPSASNTVSSTTITDKPTGTTAPPTTQPTTQPTTTTSTGRGTAPPAASPTAYLDIAFGSEYTQDGIYPELGWFFWYQPWSQQKKDACKWTNSFNLDGTYDTSNPNYPVGSFRMVADQPNGCYYLGTREKPGILSCPDLTQDIQCATVTYDGGTCYLDNGPLEMDPKVRCQWGSAGG